MKSKSLTTVAALVLIGAGGFMAGRISSSSGTGDTARDTQSGSKASRSSGSSADGGASGLTTKKSQHPERSARSGGSLSKDRLVRLESIIRGENPLDRNRALLAFIDQLGPGDFEAAVSKFRDLGITDSRFGEYSLLLSAWAKADPMAALTYAKANTGSPFATNTILTTWASVDPEAAISWAKANHDGDGANPYFAGIIRSLAESDPARATELLSSMPRSQERGEALDAMLPHLLTQGTDVTRSWIDGLADAALKNGAMMRVADKLAETDPAGTAAWLLANPGEATKRRMDDVYSVWAKNDQQAAVSSLASLPSGEERSNALRGVVSSIALSNPQEAVSMMNRFPNDVTDRVVQHFVWHSMGSDPSVAMTQIPRIADEDQRNHTYDRVLERWIDHDSTAAMAWVQSNPLPQAVQDHVNKIIKQQQQQ